MKPSLEKLIFDIVGLCCCLIPPICCTCAYFPVWKQTVGGWQMVGGTTAIIAIIAAIVVSKFLKVRVKSPAPVWIALVAWLFFEFIEKMVSGLKVVTLWMFIGCAIGSVFFWLADQAEKKGQG